MKKFIYILICFLLIGCARLHQTPETVFQLTTLESDPYKKTKWVKGPIYWNTGFCLLRAFINEYNNVSIYQFYITDRNKNWIFYNRAYDSNGEKLNFLEIDRRVSSGMTEEDFVIEFERSYLDQASFNGLNIKAVGKRGENVFILPPYYIQGFLQKVDSFTKYK